MTTPPALTAEAIHVGRIEKGCALLAGMIGVMYLGVYVFPRIFGNGLHDYLAMVLFVGIVALLLITSAVGYWLGKRWGWYVQLASGIGQLVFPGGLFEFKLDAYHLPAWIGPILTLVMLAFMWNRKRSQ